MSSEEPSAGSSHLLWPGLIVMALAVVGYMTAQPILSSARPGASKASGFPHPASPEGFHAFYARLWEDPLEMCYTHKDETNNVFGNAESQLTEWLASREILPPSRGYKDSSQQLYDNSKKRLICLPVMLPGAPYGDDHEQRMRICYAVQAALSACNYRLSYPTRMSFVDVPVQISIENFPEPRLERSFRVPVKLFHRIPDSSQSDDSRPENVLVLWINEDQAQARPLNVIAQVLTELFRPFKLEVEDWRSGLDVRVLGPFNSDVLRTIKEELAENNDPVGPCELRYRLTKFGNCTVYSPRATVPQSVLDDATYPANAKQGAAARPGRPTEVLAPDGNPVIRRTIGDDKVLATALAKELKLRGKLTKKGTVVLVTERDTLYGQTFGKVFRECAEKLFQACAKSEEPLLSDKNFKEFMFFRGIDGELPGGRPAINAYGHGTPEPSGKDSNNDQDRAADVRPTGKAQLDYLSRLEQNLIELHGQARIDGQDGISAIGIVGSDVYDKLLILRALRKRFPNVVFFTTDLDAEFCDPGEKKTARNLIVASHFGLQLEEHLQHDVPPFRDSYQTAMFFGALIALDDASLSAIPTSVKKDPWNYRKELGEFSHLEPLTFEIGLNRPYQLTLTSTSEPRNDVVQAVHPPSPRETTSACKYVRRAGLFLGAGMALGFCLIVYVSRLRRAMAGEANARGKFLKSLGLHVLFLFFLIAIPFAWILWDHQRLEGQPFALDEGISLWPATIVRYLAGLVAILLIRTSLRDLYRSNAKLDQECAPRGVAGKRFVGKDFWNSLKEQGVRAACAAAWDNAFLFNWPDVRKDWKRDPQPGVAGPKATDLYDDYAQRGNSWFRILRIIPLIIAYFAFGTFLFNATDQPSHPYRGWVSDKTSKVTLILAVSLMIVLVFLVVDATQLCRRFIKALKHSKLDWDSAGLDALANARGQNVVKQREAVKALYTVRIIADCSNVVGKLIIYPFVVVFLMIISRLPAFDYLDLNWILMLLWSLMLGAAAISSYSVRRSASETRRELLTRLRNGLSALAGDKRLYQQQLQTIRDIKQESGGAFGSFLGDPLLTALAIPFGGSTVIILIQQLLPSLFL